MKIVQTVRAAAAIEDNYSITDGVLVYSDGYNLRGAILLIGASQTNAISTFNNYKKSEQNNQNDSADWWKQDEKTEIDTDDDTSFLGTQNGTLTWTDNSTPDDIALIKVYYTGILKKHYEKATISLKNGTPIIILADDEFESSGLSAIITSQLDMRSFDKLSNIQQDIEKYGITIINIA